MLYVSLAIHMLIFTDIHNPPLSAIEDGNLPTFTNKIVDLEGADKETMHLLVFLLLQFISRPDQVSRNLYKPL